MPAYVSQDGYKARFGEAELLALAGDGQGGVDEAVWGQAVADTEAEADTYLGARYSLPLPTVPDAVRAAAHQIIRYRLNPYATEDGPERRGYTEATDWLRRISKGEATLGLTEDQREEVGGTVAVVGPERTFGDWSGYI